MSIASDNYQPNLYTGDGSTVNFSFTWQIEADTDLVVRTYDPTTGTWTTLTLGTDYTVPATALDTPGGGTVTLTTAPATGLKVLLKRAVPLAQQTSLRNTGSYNPEDVEDALDLLCLMIQQLGWLVGACVSLPENLAPSAFNPSLPEGPSAGVPLVVNENADGFKWGNQLYRTLATKTVTANYLVVVGDQVIFVDTSAGEVDVTLPDPGSMTGQEIVVVLVKGGNLSKVYASPWLISSSYYFTLGSQYAAVKAISSGTAWFVMSSYHL